MDADLRDRRERTWELLVIEGLQQAEVVERLAAEYDVTTGTIRRDIGRMDEWLPALASRPATDESRLKELRQTRQRLYQMAREAHQNDDLRLELDIHREIIRTLTLDDDLQHRLDEDDVEADTFIDWLTQADEVDDGE